MLASRKTGIYREPRVRLSSYWFVLRQKETVNTRGLNHRTNRKTKGIPFKAGNFLTGGETNTLSLQVMGVQRIPSRPCTLSLLSLA
jgi:hypothetical protein